MKNSPGEGLFISFPLKDIHLVIVTCSVNSGDYCPAYKIYKFPQVIIFSSGR